MSPDPRMLDPYTPGHGTAAYRVGHYELDLDIRLASNRLEGHARITATAQEDLDVVVLNLTGLKTLKVRVNGTKPAKTAQRGDALLVRLRTSIPSGEDFALDVHYEGTPGLVDGVWGEIGWEELQDGVLVAGQPTGAPTWFPCNDHPSQKASFRITATADAGYRVVSNGVLTAQARRSSRETWVYEQREPMAPYLATLIIGRFRELELGTCGKGDTSMVTARAVIPPDRQAETASGLSDQVRMIELFSDLFGAYPFPNYTVVVTEDELEIPLEAQTISIMGRNHTNRSWQAQRLLAHELAHQWFGNSITARVWQDIWLHEGFACYAEWLWSEHAGLDTAQERAVDAWRRLEDEPQDLEIGRPGPELMFDDRVYKRGALTLHALRLAVGDDLFFRSLQTYGSEHRHQNASTDDLVRVFDHVCGGVPGFDAQSLINRWIFREALPPMPNKEVIGT